MLLHPKTGKKLVSPKEAAEIYGCGPSNLRMLAKANELSRVFESERRVYYYLDEIERLSREKAKTRRKRGGRPRKGTDAA